jgi:CRISPR-associated protein (TIGR03984 family)
MSMSDSKDITHPITDEWLVSHASHIFQEERGTPWAWALVQEPAMVSFGVITPKGSLWNGDVDWSRLTDLRIFSKVGEWHVWQKKSGVWGTRLRKFAKGSDEIISQHHYIWGTQAKKEDGVWSFTYESRGFKVYIPASFENEDLPLYLEVNQVVDYHPETHIAGIVDAFLTGLYTRDGRALAPNLERFKEGVG